MLKQFFFVIIAVIGLSIIIYSSETLAQPSSSKSLTNNLNLKNDSLSVYLLNFHKRIESLELQNNLLIKSMESQLSEAERKSRFLQITLAILGGLLGIIVAVNTFANIKQSSWERKVQEGKGKWDREVQERRESREGGVVDALQKNVETVTNLMQIIAEGQKLAAFVKETVELQKEKSKLFIEEILAINSDSEKLLKEGLLKRRMARLREIQGKIAPIGNRIERVIQMLPLVPFEIGEEEKLSATALYVRALHLFINSDYANARKLFTESQHLVKSGDLLWQIPYYEGLMSKNEGSCEAAILSFEEAITARQRTDPELGSRTEIAEITYFKWSEHKDTQERKKGLFEARSRCLAIIKEAEGIEQKTDVSLTDIVVGKNPDMTDEFRRLQARSFLIAGNSYWLDGDFNNALIMYQKSSQIRLTSVYAFSSVAQALEKLNSTEKISDDPLQYYEKAFNALHSRLGIYDEAHNRVLRAAVFALCIKRLKDAKRIEGGWEPIQYRIEAEKIVRDELKFKNPQIKLFSPFSKLHMNQDEFLEELHREIS